MPDVSAEIRQELRQEMRLLDHEAGRAADPPARTGPVEVDVVSSNPDVELINLSGPQINGGGGSDSGNGST